MINGQGLARRRRRLATCARRRPGSFTIPGPSAIVNGKKRHDGRRSSVEVVAGAPGASPTPTTPSPFLMPGMPAPPSIPGMPNIPWPFGDDTTPDDEPQPTTRADLDMKEAAPDARAFLRAIVDKTSAVVGEQVTVALLRLLRARRAR